MTGTVYIPHVCSLCHTQVLSVRRHHVLSAFMCRLGPILH